MADGRLSLVVTKREREREKKKERVAVVGGEQRSKTSPWPHLSRVAKKKEKEQNNTNV